MGRLGPFFPSRSLPPYGSYGPAGRQRFLGTAQFSCGLDGRRSISTEGAHGQILASIEKEFDSLQVLTPRLWSTWFWSLWRLDGPVRRVVEAARLRLHNRRLRRRSLGTLY